MTAFTATISILKNVPSAIVFPYRLLSPPVAWLLSPFLVLLQFGVRSLSLLLYGPITVLSRIKVSIRICLACIYADSGPTINSTASLSDRFSTSTADRPPLLELWSDRSWLC
ncbi:hypothetical protein K440DRAFT_616877 [Wilcoxina mikolae CBS 423.85]|nr:hypothetical protein K440DRAFT_616877 [Wilcoxina mikolae CBS 423.85]